MPDFDFRHCHGDETAELPDEDDDTLDEAAMMTTATK